MKHISVLRTLIRYWRMAHDPRTPPIVRYLIYGGLAYSLSPVDLLPDWIPGLGLLDDAAILPGVVAAAMLLIPQEVKEGEDKKAEQGIARKQVEAMEKRPEHEKPKPETEARVQAAQEKNAALPPREA
jgi:uncharacterized membrane protein YkvA (DUF1232 family)